MMIKKELKVQALEWTGASLKVLDQRLLPGQLIFDEYFDAQGVYEAIKSMRVRGAPAIGIAAGYGVALSVIEHYSETNLRWKEKVADDIKKLSTSRPTAVNLFWALEIMEQGLNKHTDDPIANAIHQAELIHAEDIQANLKMGELGAD